MDAVALDEVLLKDPDGTWFFIHVPKSVRDRWKPSEHRGTIKVTVTVGSTTYDASLLPWADGSAQVSVGRTVREREGLHEGDLVHATLTLR